MEKSSSFKNTDEAKLLSCWECFKLKLPWRKRKGINTTTRQRSVGCNMTTALCRTKPPKPVGGFRYDPLSYAQNFDEGNWDDDNDNAYYRGFSSRFAAPSSRSLRVDNIE